MLTQAISKQRYVVRQAVMLKKQLLVERKYCVEGCEE
jgi:hypothetical protein